MERPVAWTKLKNDKDVFAFASDYETYLTHSKTERECVTASVTIAEEYGFINLKEVLKSGKTLKPGDRVYRCWMNKSLMLFIVGNSPITAGMNILGAHIDSPRLDIKQNPLYEDSGLAYLDTHYYGGIKKYQWVAMPLAIHGVVIRKDGQIVPVVVGEDPADPVFCISDLLPHLSQEQMEKKAAKLIEGEALNLLIGGRPVAEKEAQDGKEEKVKEPVKANVLKLLQDKYEIEEEDFLSAELEIVPAGAARDLGFDRSMILGYGHDDRCCAYPSLRAMTDFKGVPEYTLCCILTDKEEIGSVGATGMASHFFENVTAEFISALGCYSDFTLRQALLESRMLSSDVSAGYDPEYASAFEKKNAAYLSRGICFNKYTGSRGKSGSNDANPEFMAMIRRILDDEGICFQTAELGRVDLGGGGTIAYLCAKYGMNVIDSGIPVLSMHAPWEVISKADLYEGYRCYIAFLKHACPLEN
ncbi:MAG: aminopeptidase [Clostridia bacterium]|nr:aminopeptidase [Clostridia bacterium]